MSQMPDREKNRLWEVWALTGLWAPKIGACTKSFSEIESSPSTPRIFSPYEPVTIKKDVLEVHDLR